jgi:hypothetical protein
VVECRAARGRAQVGMADLRVVCCESSAGQQVPSRSKERQESGRVMFKRSRSCWPRGQELDRLFERRSDPRARPVPARPASWSSRIFYSPDGSSKGSATRSRRSALTLVGQARCQVIPDPRRPRISSKVIFMVRTACSLCSQDQSHPYPYLYHHAGLGVNNPFLNGLPQFKRSLQVEHPQPGST